MTDILNGGGELGAQMRALNWAETPLGLPENWPQSLRSAVGICLNSRFPIAIYWGPQLALLYNDAWSPILGEKHQWALGRPGREVWPEIWSEIGPLFEVVQRTGEGVWQQDQLLLMHRHGYTEECYFNFTFSPIHGEDGSVAGIFNAVIETTFRLIEERRAQLLRHLSEHSAGAKSMLEACVKAAEVLEDYPADVPFCLFYMRENTTAALQFAAVAGAALPDPFVPAVIDPLDPAAPWPVAQALQQAQAVLCENLGQRFGSLLPGALSPELVERALIVPVPSLHSAEPVGLLIAGLSPRRALDTAYHTFIERIAMQLAAAIGNAQTYQAERQRAETLAALDRAKTEFFSNVSHEFRTPLTLLLGPLEDSLADSADLPVETRERLTVAHRNALRLLKLVNTLLDFSRIEAGRTQASYQPTNLARFTAELASAFRSSVERAGLRLIVSCPALPEPLYIDREMWEKIVFNLLSNAFKFTYVGEIEVALRQSGASVELIVRDTGIGIPAEEIPHLFERFHRVTGAQGRTIEGSGIGLALVQELVKLHGGAIFVESEAHQGTTFIVSVPMGAAHLPAERISTRQTLITTGLSGEAYVEEALRWLPEDDAVLQLASANRPRRPAAEPGRTVQQTAAHILLVDDNADMRDYIRRLLSQKYAVVAVNDGAAALRVIRERSFDLVLTDVMMPHVDGFELLAALRKDERTRTLPVILLSARAGEESRSEGMEAGADDYLVKPFSARELLARVGAHVTMARVRREAAQRERELRAEAQAAREQLENVLASVSDQFLTLNTDWRYVFVNDRVTAATGQPREALLGQSIWEQFPEIVGTAVEHELRRAVADQRPVQIEHFFARWNRWFEMRGYPSVSGLTLYLGDITERKQIESIIRESEERFRRIADAAPVLIWIADTTKQCIWFNKPWLDFTGRTLEQEYGDGWIAGIHSDDVEYCLKTRTTAFDQRKPFSIEYRLRSYDGQHCWLLDHGVPYFSANGEFIGYIGSCIDISDHKRRELNTAFLGDMTANLALLTSSSEMMRIAGERIASHLKISRCLFCGIDQYTGQVTIFDEYCEPGLPSLNPVHHVEDWASKDVWHMLIAGQDIVIDDIATSSYVATKREKLYQADIGSCIAAPCLSGGRLKFVLMVSHRQQHHWNIDEQELIHELALRIWLSYDRARADAELRASAARQALLLLLLQGQREMSDPHVMLSTAAAAVGHYLGANRVGFFELRDDETLSFLCSWTDKLLAPLSGTFPATGIGTRYLAEVRAGQVLGIADTETDALTADSQFGSIGARSIIGVPIIRGGRWHAGLFVNQATVRSWTEAEIALVRDVGEQTWDAVERARAEAALRDAQARRLAEEQQHAARLQQLNAASLAINAAPTRDDLLQRITDEARMLIGATHAFVTLVAEGDPARVQTMVSLATPNAAWPIHTDLADQHMRTIISAAHHPAVPAEPDESSPEHGLLSAPLTDGDGATIGIIRLSDKITGQFTAADEALLQQFAQMASVALENQTLYEQEQVARTQAEQASRLKDEFLATVSHELRTPLTALLGYSQLLQSRKRDEAYVARTAEKLVRSAKDQALIIDDLLDVSRIVNGKLRIEPQPIDLITVIQAALDTVRPAIEAKKIQLLVDLQPQASMIIGDANRLQQVVWNLLSNATKFTPPEGRINVRLEQHGRDAQLTVRDTGQGILPSFLPFVFDRFRQSDSTSNRTHGGLGLGLAIVRHLVELHGGTVQAASDGEGQGATFIVRLPLSGAGNIVLSTGQDAEQDDPGSIYPPELRGLRVLVVDDQPDILDLIADILASCGAIVRTCQDTRRALAMLRSWKPDVLVSDIAMPGEDGYWLIQNVRSLAPEEGGSIPAIALTAYVRVEERTRVLAAGFQLYVPKPVEPAELRTVIAHLVRMEVAT